ncbi:MAG: TIGR03545 family protein, partial [Gemmatimonadaceae bacterium]
MSTAGSVRSGQPSQYTPPAGTAAPPPGKPGRVRVFRWQGIIPLLLAGALLVIGWTLFADRIVRGTVAEAGTKALGAQLDIDGLTIHSFATTLEMRGVALADPFDSTRNLFEVGRLVVALEPEPLLEKKLVVRQLSITDVRTGTVRETPARSVQGGGFAPRALAEVRRFADQFRVPLLSLTPIDTLQAIALDPSQLRTVQAALALGQQADSARASLDQAFNGLRLQETLDSSAAVITRLQSANVRTLGVQGARTAVTDLRRALARVDSARGRVDRLVNDTRRAIDSLQAGAAALDQVRRDDYQFARSLLQLPSIDAPDIGAALFGQVTIDKFQQAMYWATLARQYAPPGLLPKEKSGPQRVRAAGSTIRFITPQSYPQFLVQRADVNVTTAGPQPATYTLAVRDLTSEPAIVGRPTLFALRRASEGGTVDSLRVTGSVDHLRDRPREIVNVHAAGVALPRLAVPSLPLAMDPGRGSSELRFVLDGNQVTGRWSVRSSNLRWVADSARARRLNTIEALVSRVLTGIEALELTAEISGTLEAPRLAVRSNLDRQVADRLRTIAGEEIAAAQAKVRAQVDRIVDEKTASVKARIADLRSEGERRLTEGKAKLDEERRKLEE